MIYLNYTTIVLPRHTELPLLTFIAAKFPSDVKKWGIRILTVFGICDVTTLSSLNWSSLL